MAKSSEQNAFGIDALVAKLRKEGVEQAQIESEKMIADAKAKARQIIIDAQNEGEVKIKQANERIAVDQRAAQDALKVSYRDMVLDLKSHLLSRFSEDVERLVSESVQSEDMIKSLVLAAAQRIVQQADISPQDKLSITLPESVLELEDIIKDPQQAGSDALAEFVFSEQRHLLEKGIEFSRRDDGQAGILIKLEDKKISVDLTDKAIADMLLTYLNPRFRALLDGIIH